MELLGLMAAGVGAAADPIALAMAVALYLPTERFMGPATARGMTPALAALTALAMSLIILPLLSSRGAHINLGYMFAAKWVAAMYHQWGFIGVRAFIRATRRKHA
jgi:hypothetical protein